MIKNKKRSRLQNVCSVFFTLFFTTNLIAHVGHEPVTDAPDTTRLNAESKSFQASLYYQPFTTKRRGDLYLIFYDNEGDLLDPDNVEAYIYPENDPDQKQKVYTKTIRDYEPWKILHPLLSTLDPHTLELNVEVNSTSSTLNFTGIQATEMKEKPVTPQPVEKVKTAEPQLRHYFLGFAIVATLILGSIYYFKKQST